jgi:hypothetical protein
VGQRRLVDAVDGNASNSLNAATLTLAKSCWAPMKSDIDVALIRAEFRCAGAVSGESQCYIPMGGRRRRNIVVVVSRIGGALPAKLRQ